MNAKVISGGDLHLFSKLDQASKKPNSKAAFSSQLSFVSSIANAKPRPLSIETPSGSFIRARATARAAASGFYTPQRNQETFYELLGISEGVAFSDIKKAYKQLARKYHPDVSPPERAEEYTKRFIMVQEAYETLSDPQTRALYDRDLARGLHLAFPAGRRSRYGDETSYEADEWKKRWQSQLNGLRMRSANRESSGKMSWGARMRRQRNDDLSSWIQLAHCDLIV